MILTGSEITRQVASGAIDIEPFAAAQVNPNSYNYRLGNQLSRVTSRDGRSWDLDPLPLRDGRWLLIPDDLYLGTTLERIGSSEYVTSLIGRSSIGRLGLFVQVSANIGHQGAVHKWTLELAPCRPIYLYPGQILGQVSFWQTDGEPRTYRGRYGSSDIALTSKMGATG